MSRTSPNPSALGGPRRRLGLVLATALLAACAAAPAQAGPVSFATFSQTTGSHVTWLNFGGPNGPGFLFDGSSNVVFNYLVPTNGAPTGPINAVLQINVSTNQPATVSGGSVDQPINQATSTIRVTDATPAHHNLLTLHLTGDITGFLGGSTGTLSGDSASPKFNVVSYSSDYLGFAPGGSYSINLPNITNTAGGTGLQLAANGLLQNFVTDAQGSFSGFITSPAAVPAPASLAMLGTGALAPLGVLLSRRRKARATARA